MNLPSSLALPRSRFFQSRSGILVLALVAVLAGGGLFFAWRRVSPPVSPTPATSPAAQAPVRAVAVPKAEPLVVVPPTVYGPLSPKHTWKQPALATGAAPGVGAIPATGTSAVAVGAAPAVPGAVVAGAPASAIEAPKSLDASVLFTREQYTYTSEGRRDPFQSLIDGKFQSQSGEAGLIDVGDIHLVGIMWGSSDKFALVEDSRGRGYVLRVGDPVVNGYISGISKSELQIVQNAFGESQSMSIKLQTKEGDENATRN
jgi:hypothetical protein